MVLTAAPTMTSFKISENTSKTLVKINMADVHTNLLIGARPVQPSSKYISSQKIML